MFLRAYRKISPAAAAAVASLFAVLGTLEVQDEEAVAVVALDGGALDGAGEADGLLEAAVGDLDLLADHALGADRVAPAAADDELGAADLDLQLVGADAGQLQLDDPPVARPVHVGRRRPQPPRRHHPLRLRQHAQVAFD